MADQEKTIRDVIREARLMTEAERTAVSDIVLPVMTTRSGEELARDSAAAVGLVVDVRTNYAQKGGGPVPLIVDLESFIRAHGADGWRLLEGAAASWVVKKAADSLWARVIAWVREVQKRSPDGATLQVIAVDKKDQRRHYKVGSKAKLDDAITQLALDLDTPGAPGERLWFEGRWIPSSEYFERTRHTKES
jgi:hypothetical protein